MNNHISINPIKIQPQEPDWFVPKKQGYYAQPYTLPEVAALVGNYCWGPSGKHAWLKNSAPQDIVHEDSTPKVTIAFVGDIMPFNGKHIRVNDDIKEFVSDADILVANLEGTISPSKPKKVFMSLHHDMDVLEFLADFFPPKKTLLSCANNHAGDYGWDIFRSGVDILEQHGFTVIGRKDQASAVIDNNVQISACTDLCNRHSPYVSDLSDWIGSSLNSACNIFFPHWGYELQHMPSHHQLSLAETPFSSWNAIIGHHSHCPQPIHAIASNKGLKVVAYSLGNFVNSYDIHWKKYLNGLLLKLSIGSNASTEDYSIKRLQWISTLVKRTGRGTGTIIKEF